MRAWERSAFPCARWEYTILIQHKILIYANAGSRGGVNRGGDRAPVPACSRPNCRLQLEAIGCIGSAVGHTEPFHPGRIVPAVLSPMRCSACREWHQCNIEMDAAGIRLGIYAASEGAKYVILINFLYE
jgi:hypothetical protein